MIKIGIVTIIDNNNYGNRLQNYALQEVLKAMGAEVVTLENYWIFGNRKTYIYNKLKYSNFNKHYSDNEIRKNNFILFNKLINFSDKVISPFDKCRDFDYIICGSDQVWNPYFGTTDITLLTSIEPTKRIAYAASFGVNSMKEETQKKYKKELTKFHSISVREKTAQKIVELLCERKPEVVIDPTMLLETTDWTKVAKKPNEIENNEKFIVTYFFDDSDDKIEYVNRINKKYGYKVYNLLEINKCGKISEMGPSEFIYMISKSVLVLTDSFHACVFSLLFHVPFIVFDRTDSVCDMSGRIDDLLNKFNLNDRKKEFADVNDVFCVDFSNVDFILKSERMKSIDYLRKNIKFSS